MGYETDSTASSKRRVKTTVNYDGKVFEFSPNDLTHAAKHHGDAFDSISDEQNIDESFGDPLYVETNPATADYPEHHKYYHERSDSTSGPRLRIYIADPTCNPGRIITGWHQSSIDGTGTPVTSRHTRKGGGKK